MKEKLLILVVIVIVVVALLGLTAYVDHKKEEQSLEPITSSNTKSTMNIQFSSPEFGDGDNIPSKYTCDGDGIIPPLQITGVDTNVKSLAIVMDDPDAASVVGHTFDHWVVFNISPDTTEIEEGLQPNGVAGKNSKNELTYTGPCPPNGTHHYHFKLYALDTILGLKEGATKTELEEAMGNEQGDEQNTHILGQSEFIGLYTKNQ